MNEITDARLAAIEARWFKAAEAVVRLADERATHDTVDIICSNEDVPVLVREVRLLREQVDSAHRALAVSRMVAGELDAAAMMAVVRDCDRVQIVSGEVSACRCCHTIMGQINRARDDAQRARDLLVKSREENARLRRERDAAINVSAGLSRTQVAPLPSHVASRYAEIEAENARLRAVADAAERFAETLDAYMLPRVGVTLAMVCADRDAVRAALRDAGRSE